MTPPRLFSLLAALLLVTQPSAALAYLGPGVGLGAVGVILGVIGSFFLALAAVVWYPAKRLWRRLKQRKPPAGPDGEG